MSRDQQSVQDIWNAAQEILSFTAGMNYESLKADRRTQAAVLYEIARTATSALPMLISALVFNEIAYG